MKYRKLRIAWSATCGVLCLLLIVLWVRSYWVYEAMVNASQRESQTLVMVIGSNHGTLHVSRRMVPASEVRFGSTDGWTYQTAGAEFAAKRHFISWSSREGFAARFPVWLPAIVLYGLAVIPWIWSRFSLRALLISVTLIALVLGAIVHAMK